MRRRLTLCCLILCVGLPVASAAVSRSGSAVATPRRDGARAAAELERRLAELESQTQSLLETLQSLREHIQAKRQDEALALCRDLIARTQSRYEGQVAVLKRQLAYVQKVRARREPGGRVSLVGRPARQFQARSLDGETVTVDPSQGRITVLEWVNFMCPYSRYHYKTRKTSIELAQRYQSQGVDWVAVNSSPGVTPADYQRFLKSLGLAGLPYPVVQDPDGKLARAFAIQVTPQVVIVGRDGKIAFSGTVDNAPLGKVRPSGAKPINYVDRALSELVGDRPVSVMETALVGTRLKLAPTSP